MLAPSFRKLKQNKAMKQKILFAKVWFAGCLLAAYATPVRIAGQTGGTDRPEADKHRLEAALDSAGTNRTALLAVLDHYRGDKEKYRAACFLIANMSFQNRPGRILSYDPKVDSLRMQADRRLYGVLGTLPDSAWSGVRKDKAFQERAKRFRDSIAHTVFGQPQVEVRPLCDAATIDSAFLFAHIEHAFRLRRENPRVAAMDFDDFCERILPYRSINDYPMVCPATELAGFYGKYLCRDDTASVRTVVARYNSVENLLRYIHGSYPLSDNIGWGELCFSGIHDCVDIAFYGAAVLRACGVPALVGYNSANKLSPSHHYHVAVTDEQGHWRTFSPEAHMPLYRDKGFDRSANIFYLYFGRRDKNPYSLRNPGEPIPAALSNPCLEDHSEKIKPVVKLSLPFGYPTPNRLAYLACFHSQDGFIPVTWGIIDKERHCAEFEKVVPDNIYFPVYCTGKDRMVLFGEPFRITTDNRADKGYRMERIWPDSAETRTVQALLKRKFPLKGSERRLMEQVVGTYVVASDDKNFARADTLAVIDSLEGNSWQDLRLKGKKPYRHYKIVASPRDRHIRLSEVEFLTRRSYGYENVISATPLVGRKDSVPMDRLMAEPLSVCGKRREYDRNEQTAPEPYSTIVFHLQEPQTVEVLRFAVKNSGNALAQYDNYQLFELKDGKWNLVWTKMGMDDALRTCTLRTNTLYWLHDLSRGIEELPFVILPSGEQYFIHEHYVK